MEGKIAFFALLLTKLTLPVEVKADTGAGRSIANLEVQSISVGELQNGDIIERIDGHSPRSLAELLERFDEPLTPVDVRRVSASDPLIATVRQ